MSAPSTDPILIDSPGAARPGRLWVKCVWFALSAFTPFALTIHWVLRDQTPGLSVVYYATPAVLLGATLLITAWIGFRCRWPKGSFADCLNRCLALVGIFCLVEWVFVDFRWNGREVTAGSIKVVFWNVGRGQFATWDRIAKQVHDFDADVIVLAEATSDEVQTRQFWKSHLPEYSAYPHKVGMILLIKGTAVERVTGSLAGRGNFRHLSITVSDRSFDLFLADVAANPLFPRTKPISALYERIRGQQIPTLVVGDFNTPPSSACFDSWRPNWTRAWDAAGSGYQCTWPQPLPVLALDQIWGNRAITFQRCACGWSRCSDHRPVIANIVVQEPMESR